MIRLRVSANATHGCLALSHDLFLISEARDCNQSHIRIVTIRESLRFGFVNVRYRAARPGTGEHAGNRNTKRARTASDPP